MEKIKAIALRICPILSISLIGVSPIFSDQTM